MTLRPSRFVFTDRCFDPKSGEVSLGYALDDLPLVERFFLPAALCPHPSTKPAIDQALKLLHWVAGVSYWKTHCPAIWEFHGTQPSPEQAAFLNTLYQKGLAEFAWHHQLDLSDLVACPSDRADSLSGMDAMRAPPVGLGEGVLLPLGGGKDSLVAWHRLASVVPKEHLMSVQVGTAPLIQSLGNRLVAEGLVHSHWVIRREMDPQLAEMNAAGAMNGHVPITAINAAVLALFALVLNVQWVTFANERSADEATLIDKSGPVVNHQFSKSFEFEVLLNDWIQRTIAADLSVFSVLRTQRELAVVKDFCSLDQFHDHFSSCNRNFHLDPDARGATKWCGQCPKCHFVYLAMAVFLPPEKLVAIFGSDLLDHGDCIEGFEALLALDGVKPFECVGEAAEARAALLALSHTGVWKEHVVVKRLAPLLADLDVPSIDELLEPVGPHLMPEALLS